MSQVTVGLASVFHPIIANSSTIAIDKSCYCVELFAVDSVDWSNYCPFNGISWELQSMIMDWNGVKFLSIFCSQNVLQILNRQKLASIQQGCWKMESGAIPDNFKIFFSGMYGVVLANGIQMLQARLPTWVFKRTISHHWKWPWHKNLSILEKQLCPSLWTYQNCFLIPL